MTTPAGDPEQTFRVDANTPLSPQSGGSARKANDAQFAPGTMIAGRYRIASLLGAGGMGEVYRADDVRLGQTVALKFLPARVARDAMLLERLHDEVRLGRQITHPNVCRLYDIVDWNQAQFVAMEYVDGEDLARLLRRIGRLAHDKAVDITRGIAAGLGAAHAKGILHRDLKPANVMIDSTGDARIMDFGLALTAGEHDGTISGTPAYMAPEQLDGAAATVQSDLYALGLVMYELFTGRRAHEARSFNERLRDITTEIATPSSVVRDIDPAVERVILRCLSSDPAQRPRSAREIIDALPGGDPLAAALAAGDTPSPGMVAAAGTEGSLKPAAAWALLGAIVLCLALIGLRSASGSFLQRAGMTMPPEALHARASAVLQQLGVPRQPFDASGFELKDGYVAWIWTHDQTPQRWERLRRGLPAVTFWLREERAPLLDEGTLNTPEPVRSLPAPTAPGSVAIEIDQHGRLYSLSVLASEWEAQTLDWSALLDAAGLDDAKLTSVAPSVLPPTFADARAAWSGTHPDDGTPIRVEAAALRGVPVFFRIEAPWNAAGARVRVPFASGPFALYMALMILTTAVIAVFLAWRNLRLRRGDRQAALRIGIAVFSLEAFVSVAVAQHEPVFSHEIRVLLGSLAKALFRASVFALVYVALEPYVRRRWPDRLISWARLVAGKWRDPMVGRDLLIGIVAGSAHALIAVYSTALRDAVTGMQSMPAIGDIRLLDSPLRGFSHVADAIAMGVVQGMAMMAALMILTMLFRRRWLAAAALYVVFLIGYSFASTDVWMVPVFTLLAAVVVLVLARVGMLGAVAMQATFLAIFAFPAPDALDWYTVRALVPIALAIAAALWAFKTSLGSQRAFNPSLLDEA